MEWVSASEGARFAQVVADFTKTLKELGPLKKDAKIAVSQQD